MRLYRTLYSQPAPTNFSWHFNSSRLSAPEYNVTNSTTQVLLPVHGESVRTQGWRLSLDVTVSPDSEGVYTLSVCNAIGCNSSDVILRAAGTCIVMSHSRSSS